MNECVITVYKPFCNPRNPPRRRNRYAMFHRGIRSIRLGYLEPSADLLSREFAYSFLECSFGMCATNREIDGYLAGIASVLIADGC